MIKACVACDPNGGIGKNGTLPWSHNKDDMMIFKKYTDGQAMIMGMNTWLDPSFPVNIGNRKSIVYTKNRYNATEKPSPDKYITDDEKLFDGVVIGGASIIEMYKDDIYEISLSIMDDIHECDTYIDLDYFSEHFKPIKIANYDNFTHYIMKRK